jgi:hypothetical protein
MDTFLIFCGIGIMAFGIFAGLALILRASRTTITGTMSEWEPPTLNRPTSKLVGPSDLGEEV